MKYGAVIFDYDYTLADSEKGILICFKKLFEEIGVEKISDYAIKRTIGLTLEQAFTELLGVTDREELERLRRKYVAYGDRYMVENTVLYPETETLLMTLRAMGIKTGILSSKYAYRIKKTLDPLGIAPDAIVGGEAVRDAKPYPEGLFALIKTFRLSAAEVLYVGDSTVDAQTAQNAGTDFIGVTQGATAREELERFLHVAVVGRIGEILRFI